LYPDEDIEIDAVTVHEDRFPAGVHSADAMAGRAGPCTGGRHHIYGTAAGAPPRTPRLKRRRGWNSCR
ncbi:hypothetical protein ABT224_21530, partial [Streptomyces sp. NPDC001584]|uniref:hypothetical protein n=1 Tax=Streptomyces sp. NPDC001584 TaxID=3154521 RepID=UPI0033172DA9